MIRTALAAATAFALAIIPTSASAQVRRTYEDIKKASDDIDVFIMTEIWTGGGKEIARIPMLVNCEDQTFAFFNNKTEQLDIQPLISKQVIEFCARISLLGD